MVSKLAIMTANPAMNFIFLVVISISALFGDSMGFSKN